jgi:putative DNA primase/helicase
VAEVERLARLPEVEWRFYLTTENYAARFGVDNDEVGRMVAAVVKTAEKKAREDKADERYEQRRTEQKQEREDRRARQDEARDRKEAERARREAKRIEREEEAKRKKRETAFAEIADLPKLTHAVRLREVAARLGEDFETLVQEFGVYLAARTIPEDLAPWGEPVDTAELLAAIETKYRRYVVTSGAVVMATVLWVPFSYVVEIATHAPKLLYTSPVKDAGKTTALHVVRWMVQRSYPAVEATGAVLYRIIDRLKPTLLLDEADTLFQRRNALAHIINESWTNSGSKIPRAKAGGKGFDEYDVYGAQLISMKGLHVPDTTASRCIIGQFLPKLASELVDEFTYLDDDEFKMIRRKLQRWAIDNAVVLRAAKPDFPPGFNNRVRVNWKMLLAIADLAGDKWSKRARNAALELETGRDEQSEEIRLLAGLRDVWSSAPERTSESLCAALAAHPTGEWADFRGKGPISQHQLAAFLRVKFMIRPFPGHPTKRSDVTRGSYKRGQFEELWARLLQKPSQDSNTQTPGAKVKLRGRPRK